MAKEIYHPVLSFHAKSCAGCTGDRSLHGKPVTTKATVPATVAVTKCPVATEALQREASRAFFPSAAERAGRVAPRGAFLGLEGEAAARAQREAFRIENDAERRMELFHAAREAGASVSDALDEMNGY